jgi:hypothetical protein
MGVAVGYSAQDANTGIINAIIPDRCFVGQFHPRDGPDLANTRTGIRALTFHRYFCDHP